MSLTMRWGRVLNWDSEADVVVVGAGATGLPAAIVAREAGSSVIVVEAQPHAGGHAMISGGNVPLRGFLLAMLTRLFNVVQDLRGGASYPFMPPATVSGPTPTQALDLSFDETATVRAKEEIAATLVNNRNRGLWFDREMIRFCNRSAVVHSRVKRVIHESTGKMVVMKTPSIVLKNVIATGEFLRLCPQHEYIFWREIWLRRAAVDAATRDANR